VTCGVWIFVGYWTVDTAEGYKNAVDQIIFTDRENNFKRN
jgi:hypothetical protein